ncbi:MAG TPA: hypothetical protein VNG33_02610 [Polyangiaceae bacterium]|nr:hypothetical protein [Polyangiaceae bacterium]
MHRARRGPRLLTWGLAGFLLLELGSWWLWGRARLTRELPGIARCDLLDQHLDDPAHHGPQPGTLIVRAEETPLPDEQVLSELYTIGEQFHFVVRPGVTSASCGGCKVFEYTFHDRIPCYADVRTYVFDAPGYGSFYTHKRLWLLGFWLTLADRHYADS